MGMYKYMNIWKNVHGNSPIDTKNCKEPINSDSEFPKAIQL